LDVKSGPLKNYSINALENAPPSYFGLKYEFGLLSPPFHDRGMLFLSARIDIEKILWTTILLVRISIID
jgi:hypothetical protein